MNPSQKSSFLVVVVEITSLLMQKLVGFGMKHLSHLIQDKDLLNSQLFEG